MALTVAEVITKLLTEAVRLEDGLSREVYIQVMPGVIEAAAFVDQETSGDYVGLLIMCLPTTKRGFPPCQPSES